MKINTQANIDFNKSEWLILCDGLGIQFLKTLQKSMKSLNANHPFCLRSKGFFSHM